MRFVSFHDWIRKIYATRHEEMDCEQVAELMPAYVDGLVARQESDGGFTAVEQHLAQCAHCLEVAAALREVAEQESEQVLPVAAHLEPC
jgi:predicted anti-sigma-YlaC factor YlaD